MTFVNNSLIEPYPARKAPPGISFSILLRQIPSLFPKLTGQFLSLLRFERCLFIRSLHELNMLEKTRRKRYNNVDCYLTAHIPLYSREEAYLLFCMSWRCPFDEKYPSFQNQA